jgi:hypothetical protein
MVCIVPILLTSAKRLIYNRANRAQYGEVSFQTVSEDEITNVNLPSTQGLAEEEGMLIRFGDLIIW